MDHVFLECYEKVNYGPRMPVSESGAYQSLHCGPHIFVYYQRLSYGPPGSVSLSEGKFILVFQH